LGPVRRKYAVAAPERPEPMMVTSVVGGRFSVVRCPRREELRAPWSQKERHGLGCGKVRDPPPIFKLEGKVVLEGKAIVSCWRKRWAERQGRHEEIQLTWQQHPTASVTGHWMSPRVAGSLMLSRIVGSTATSTVSPCSL
jgi:hypothetical protein